MTSKSVTDGNTDGAPKNIIKGITLFGLGPGDPNLLTREAWTLLETETEIYLRTAHHPAVANLPATLEVHTFDSLYESLDSFSEVYEQIVERIMDLGTRPEGVVYAVPGHPFVAEATGPEIARRAKATGIPLQVCEAISIDVGAG